MWRFAFRSVVLAALVVFNILAGTDARAESGFLDIINTTDAEVSVIAVADDKSQTVLYQLPAGETYSLPVEAGTLLGFASGDSWVGDGYVVSGGDGESVSVPYAEAEAGAAAAEPAGNEITLKNTTAAKVMVIAIGDDGTQQKVADIAAKKSARVNVPAGTLLGFAQNGDWLGDGYVVSEEADQSASIPYKEKTQAAAGGGVTVGNTSETAITVVSIGSDGKQTALFNVPAGKSASVAIKKGTLLGFAQAGAWLGDGYTVTGGENETVMVPVIAEAAAAAAPEAEQSEAGADQFPVKINNTNAMAIGVVVVAADGAQSILSQVKAGAAAQFNLSAGTKLGFSIKDETGKLAWSGDAFIVPDGGGEVQVPYQAVAQAETPAAGDAQEKAKAALSPLQIAQAGEGSVKINFSNTQANAIVVAALGDDKSPHPLYTIKPGAVQSENALPGTTLMFYDAASLSRTGDAFVVPSDSSDIDLPYNAASAFLKRELKKAPDVAPTPLFNFYKTAVAVFAKDGDTPAVKLFELAPGAVNVPVLGTGTKLFFVEEVPGQDNKAIGEAYTVVKGAAPVGIPYRAPSDLVASWAPRATVRVDLLNILMPNNPAAFRPEPVFVMASDPDVKVPEGAGEDQAPKLQLVGMVYPMASFEQHIMAPPKTVLRFVLPGEEGAEPTFYGEGYYVTEKSATVSLPVATSLEDQLVAQIDLNKLATDIAASLIKANGESSGPKACWKNTETRGVGTVPRNCLPNQVEDTAGLCYEKCAPGYYSNKLTMCIPECPAGFRDDGLYCYKPGPITRDEYPWKFGDGLSMDDAMDRCRRDHGSNCILANANTMVYSTCPANYHQAPIITNLCTPTCPAGMTDIGISCQKNTYDRGVGQLMQCDPGMERDAGLCYTPCPAGYDSVGPVCWKQCPKTMPVNCGASCAKTEGDCAQSVVDQVTSPLITAGNIALIVVTAGGAAAATTGAEAGAAGAKVGAEVGTEIAAKEAVKAGIRESLKAGVRSALKSGAMAAFKAGGKAVIIDQAKQAAISAILTGAISGGVAIAAKKKLESSLNEKLGDALSKYFTDDQIESVVNTAIEASGSGKVDFPLESLDPTGIAQIVVAYNLPLCSDVKDVSP